jgi:hemoglobin-like flavoprotein
MTSRQVALVRGSWKAVRPISDRAAELFYDRLFQLDPGLRSMFRGDMAAQGRKLMVMIDTVVGRLDRLGELVPAVQALGQRHAGYGVRDEHYAIVGTALLDTLRVGLGDAFDAEVEEAWATAYGTLAGVMKEAAAGLGRRLAPCDAATREAAASS